MSISMSMSMSWHICDSRSISRAHGMIENNRDRNMSVCRHSERYAKTKAETGQRLRQRQRRRQRPGQRKLVLLIRKFISHNKLPCRKGALPSYLALVATMEDSPTSTSGEAIMPQGKLLTLHSKVFWCHVLAYSRVVLCYVMIFLLTFIFLP
jgi:hypothetical protein